MNRSILFLLLSLVSFGISAQESANEICNNDDCSDDILAIKINAPLDVVSGENLDARTREFRKAYDAFTDIKKREQTEAGWQSKYNTFQLGGSNCAKFYDLESRFAYEYEQNPVFKSYIDGKESNVSSFKKAGFGSSRKSQNLTARLKRNCPSEEKKADKVTDTTPEEKGKVYTKLGQVLGYFDETGKVLKQLEAIPEAPAQPAGRQSKKEQVEQLNQAVEALPLGADTRDKISDLSRGLNDLAPQATGLIDKLASTEEKLNDLLPKPGGLLDKIGSLLGLKKPLSSYIPKIPGTGILDKIKGFFGKGKRLKEKAQELVDKANDIKQELDDTVQKAKNTGKEITDKGKEVTDLLDKLGDLQRKRDELNTKLADKPKKILDELKQEVADVQDKAKELTDKIASGAADKDKLQEELDTLNEKREELEDKIEETSKEVDDLDKGQKELEKESTELEEEVEKLKKQEDLKQQVEDLEPVEGLEEQTAECEEELNTLFAGITKLKEKKDKAKSKLGRILSFPGRMIGKVSGFIEKHAGLKTILSAIPGVSNVMNVVEGLFGKSKLLSKALEVITGKQTKLTDTLDGITSKIDKIDGLFKGKKKKLKAMQQALDGFGDDKAGLLAILSKKVDDLNPVEQQVIDLIKKHKLLGEDSACNDTEPIKEEVEEIDQELDEVETQTQEIEEELEEIQEEIDEVEAETEAVEEEVAEIEEQQEEVREQEEEIKQEEEAIKEEFGQDVDIEPVTVEEWSESFEVERPYWEATFHPDDEVVEGYKGRYFQVQLKDADQTIQLLFGPGEYHMSKTDFRKNYGSVIGVFVTEALTAIKKDKRAGVKLFVQGSADISGANSFRGNLNESFFYDELSLLPLKGSENFSGVEESRTVRERGFTNEDLPNLRGRFMQEMIGFYSKKLSPILLEGSVKKQVAKEDRNAVIYLFLPQSLMDE